MKEYEKGNKNQELVFLDINVPFGFDFITVMEQFYVLQPNEHLYTLFLIV